MCKHTWPIKLIIFIDNELRNHLEYNVYVMKGFKIFFFWKTCMGMEELYAVDDLLM